MKYGHTSRNIHSPMKEGLGAGKELKRNRDTDTERNAKQMNR